jgi:hypothetical protein
MLPLLQPHRYLFNLDIIWLVQSESALAAIHVITFTLCVYAHICNL